MTPRTGRPPSEDPKVITVRARMTREDVEMLDACCKIEAQTRSDVIRKGIGYEYQIIIKYDKAEAKRAEERKKIRQQELQIK